MLLKYLNSNRPAVLFLLPFFALSIWLPMLIYEKQGQANMVTHYSFFLQKDLLLNGIPGFISALSCMVFTGILLNRIIINSELSAKTSHIYAFMYVLAETALRTDYGFYSWQLGQLFIVASLWPLLKISNQRQVINLTFESGLLIGIASLIYPPSLLIVFIIPFFLQAFRPFNWREWFFPLIGMGLILLFYITYCLLVNKPFYLLYLFLKFNYSDFFYAQPGSLILFALVVIVACLHYISMAQRAVIHARKQRTVMIYLFLGTSGLITLLNLGGVIYANYFICLVPATLFAGHYLGNMKTKWLSGFLTLLLIASQIIKHVVE